MVALSPEAQGEFDEAVDDQAEPGEDQQAPVEAEGLVLGRKGKMRHEDEEVEEAAEDDGGELFEEAREHGEKFQVSSFKFQAEQIPRFARDDNPKVSDNRQLATGR